MKNTIISLAFMAFFICANAEPYIIGTYTQYDVWKTLGNTGNRIAQLKTKLVDGGYNAATISINDEDIDYLGNALSAFGNGVKTILDDKRWEPDNIGVAALAYGNRLKMEAEYSDGIEPSVRSFRATLAAKLSLSFRSESHLRVRVISEAITGSRCMRDQCGSILTRWKEHFGCLGLARIPGLDQSA